MGVPIIIKTPADLRLSGLRPGSLVHVRLPRESDGREVSAYNAILVGSDENGVCFRWQEVEHQIKWADLDGKKFWRA